MGEQQQVGCEREDGTLNVHPESESCEVCAPPPARAAADLREICVWTINDWGGDSVWETQCGHAFVFNDGGPDDNGFAFCGYCGGGIIEARTSDSPRDGDE